MAIPPSRRRTRPSRPASSIRRRASVTRSASAWAPGPSVVHLVGHACTLLVSVPSMSLSDVELGVCAAIAQRRDDLVALASQLVGFDTTAREVGDPARDEAPLQAHLATTLTGAGAEIDLFEPDADELAGQAAGARRAGLRRSPAADRPACPAAGAARRCCSTATSTSSRLSPADVDEPAVRARGSRRPSVRARRLRHEGGVAAMVLAAETLAPLGVALARRPRGGHQHRRGVLGRGRLGPGLARAAADAGNRDRADRLQHLDRLPWLGVWGHPRSGPGRATPRCASPTGATAARSTRSRSRPSSWRRWRSLRERWAASRRCATRCSARPSLLPTVVHGGDWPVTYPSSCELTIAVMYLPVQADADRLGSTGPRRGRSVRCSPPARRTTGWPSTPRSFTGGPTA